MSRCIIPLKGSTSADNFRPVCCFVSALALALLLLALCLPVSSMAFAANAQGGSSSKGDASAGLPKSYDLRDPNGDGDRSDSVVTPVKLQNPWNTCWAFSSVAASETSILSKLNKTYASTSLDLSELQVSLAVYGKGGVPQSVSKTQAGEGFAGNTNDGLNVGGSPLYTINVLASGIGTASEADVPFRNNEGIIECEVVRAGETSSETMYLTETQIATYREEGAQVTRLCYAGDYKDASSPKADDEGTVRTDWSGNSKVWDQSAYELQDGNVLPDVMVESGEGTDKVLDETALRQVKSEIYAGRGVALAYSPDEKWLDKTTWAHYCAEADELAHAVCVVGWDDDYSAENFNSESGKKPQGNGAWLVKNSLGSQNGGSQDSEFPNYGEWGIEENGLHTGYFWLSYYDVSVESLVSFNFDVSDYGQASDRYIDQYDFLFGKDYQYEGYKEPTASANVYTAQGDMLLRSVGSYVFKPNTTVSYQVYLLDEQAKTPTDPEHSKLVYTGQETYTYAGYHRVNIEADSWLAMRSGQRYAVVTTQKCNDDGMWYQGAAFANKKDYIFAKLNAGESWKGTAVGGEGSVGADASWVDWATCVEQLQDEYPNYTYDNTPIKGISSKASFASIEELKALENAISSAQKALAEVKISADGQDVLASDTWMTQAQHDELAAALSAVKAKFALAGDDYEHTLVNTTPSSEEVQGLLASLAFEPQQGSIQPSGGEEGKGAAQEPGSPDGDQSRLAKTADGCPVLAVLALSCFSFVLACVAFAKRQNAYDGLALFTKGNRNAQYGKVKPPKPSFKPQGRGPNKAAGSKGGIRRQGSKR